MGKERCTGELLGWLEEKNNKQPQSHGGNRGNLVKSQPACSDHRITDHGNLLQAILVD